MGGRSSAVSSDTCRYSKARGHWKKEYPVLKARESSGQVKTVALAASVITYESRELVQACTELVAPQACYSGFMVVGLIGRR